MVGVPIDCALSGSDNRVLEDYRLIDLAHGVVHRPKGRDRGLITAAIKLAESQNSQVRLSQYDNFVRVNLPQLQSTLVPRGPGISMNADVKASQRWTATPQLKAHTNCINRKWS